jgi:hypothetical protein
MHYILMYAEKELQMMTVNVIVEWAVGFYGVRQYLLKSNSIREAEAEGLELAWNELKDLRLSNASGLRKTSLTVRSARLNDEGTARYEK